MAGQTVAATGIDSKEREGRQGKADPEELFVAALSSCHMLWFVSLARAERIRVTSYEDEAEGSMDGTRFTRVVLRPRVEFKETSTTRPAIASTTRPTSAASSPIPSAAQSRWFLDGEPVNPGPLSDVKVLDLSRLLPGGFCTLMLADPAPRS